MPAEAPFSSDQNSSKGLPSVVAPSGKEIARLFLTPLLIVVGLVIPLVGFFWWFGGAWTPQDYLAKLDDPNPDVRWRGAEYLGQMLLRDDNLASDPKFGLDLAERLRQTADSTADADRALYLGSCLGSLTIPVGAPLLSRLAVTRNYRRADAAPLASYRRADAAPLDPGPEPRAVTRKRWQALWALANLGNNLKRFQRLIPERQQMVLAELQAESAGLGKRAEWAKAALHYMTGPQARKLQGLGVDKALITCAQDSDPFLREIAAFALNFWEGDASERGPLEDVLVKLAVDSGQGEESLSQLREEENKSEDTITKVPGLKIRYNATVALARRGSDKARLGVLQEMLDEPLQRQHFIVKKKGGKEEPDEATVQVTLSTALEALADLHRKKPERDLSKLYPAIEALAQSKNLAVRGEAERTLKTLSP
jgi:hypothetical protein